MRLIDADELKLELKWLEVDTPVYHDVMSTIDEIATVEVVRCKDCKWRNGLRCYHKRSSMDDLVGENDYCSFGERKDEVT